MCINVVAFRQWIVGINSDTFPTSTFDTGDSPGSRSCHLTARERCLSSNYIGSLAGLRAHIDLVTKTKVSILLSELNPSLPAHIIPLRTERICLAGIVKSKRNCLPLLLLLSLEEQ